MDRRTLEDQYRWDSSQIPTEMVKIVAASGVTTDIAITVVFDYNLTISCQNPTKNLVGFGWIAIGNDHNLTRQRRGR